VFVAIVALNQAVFITLQYFTCFHSTRFIDEFRFPYETYHTRILFFERYIRTLTYSILAYAYPRAMVFTRRNAIMSETLQNVGLIKVTVVIFAIILFTEITTEWQTNGTDQITKY